VGCVGFGGCGGVVGVGAGCGGGGWFPLAFEHSKVCTQCDFGHLQFLFLKRRSAVYKQNPALHFTI
jgi:hypothetical protein